MRVKILTENRVQDFIQYCKTYRSEVDDSFLDDEELKNFSLHHHPTYVLQSDNGELKGAVSLLINSKENTARFRIFHAVTNDISDYQRLFHAVLEAHKELKKVYLFVPIHHQDIADIFQKMQFKTERYAYLLERDDQPVQEPAFPDGFKLRAFQYGQDESVFCDVRNAAFKNQIGFVKMTPETVMEMKNWNDHVDDGILLLYNGQKPVGAVRIGQEFYKEEYYTHIGSLSVVPEYQGKGLGRNLLRAAVLKGREIGMKKAVLSVDSDNEKAVQLYLHEGFQEVQGYVCLFFNLNQ